jgi:hypothetical protein
MATVQSNAVSATATANAASATARVAASIVAAQSTNNPQIEISRQTTKMPWHLG